MNDELLITGVGLIVTFVCPGAEGQLPVVAVAITLYVPLAAVDALAIDGFCELLVKVLGPFQNHETAPANVVDAVKFKVLSAQIGPLLEATGVDGVSLITTFTDPAGETQLFNVAVTLYVPLAASVAEAIVGF